MIDDTASHYVPYTLQEYNKRDGQIEIGGNLFSREGIALHIKQEGLSLTGQLRYVKLRPLSYDIMGPFRFFPMECRHSVISMRHALQGQLLFNNTLINFNNGNGYIEGDRGRSFPQSYIWTHAGNLDEDCSIMVSIAKVPFAGLRFWGCVCFVWYLGREYRLATYKGVNILERSPERLDIRQGKYRLVVDILRQNGHTLYAPHKGVMNRRIHESPSCTARYRFYVDAVLLFDKTSHNASYEFVDASPNYSPP